MKTIPYGRQDISESDIQAVIDVLKSDYLTQGPKIKEFEDKLAQFSGSKYALVLNSGTSALHAAYFALGLTHGDDFITSPMTFVATANAGLYLGANPLFCDIEPNMGNINSSQIESKITSKTKLISPVHYAGHPADMEKISEIAKKYNLSVVEDASHAIGSTYKNSKTGSCKFSDITVFSFHPVKHITTGEGGAVLTNSKELYEKMQLFRSHGITKDVGKLTDKTVGEWYYEMQELGFNYRMTDIQAVLGISQLERLPEFIRRRREIASKYRNAFKDNEIFDIPQEQEYAQSSYHLFPILLKDKFVDKRKDFFDFLRANNIWVQVHYIPVHLQPFYKKRNWKTGDFPEAVKFYEKEISLPMYPAMTDSEQDYVINKINEFCRI